jgi:hypothetical protein
LDIESIIANNEKYQSTKTKSVHREHIKEKQEKKRAEVKQPTNL